MLQFVYIHVHICVGTCAKLIEAYITYYYIILCLCIHVGWQAYHIT